MPLAWLLIVGVAGLCRCRLAVVLSDAALVAALEVPLGRLICRLRARRITGYHG